MIRVLLALALILAPAAADAGYKHGQREYRQGGYYQWDAYACKWLWYAVKAQSYGSYDNHSQTYNLTINNYQPSARRGETGYGTTDAAYVYGSPLDPNATLNFAKELLGVAYRGANDGFAQAMSFASQQGANDVEVAKEFAQVQKLQATAQVIESSKPASSATVFRQEVQQDPGKPVRAFAQATANEGVVVGINAKCAECHADGQGAGGYTFSSLAAVDPEAGLEYINRLDDKNCAKRAKLSAEEHRAVRQYLESRKFQQ